MRSNYVQLTPGHPGDGENHRCLVIWQQLMHWAVARQHQETRCALPEYKAKHGKHEVEGWWILFFFFWLVICKCANMLPFPLGGGCGWRRWVAVLLYPYPSAQRSDLKLFLGFFGCFCFFPSVNCLYPAGFIKHAPSHAGPAHLQRKQWGGASQAGF